MNWSPSCLISVIPFIKTTPEQDSSAKLLQNSIYQGEATDVVKLIKQHNLENAFLPCGELPISYAIRLGKRDLVEQLLNLGTIDLNIKDDQNLTALDHAALSDDSQILALVMSHMIGKNLKGAQESPIDDSTYQIFTDEIKTFTSDIQQAKETLPEIHKAALEGNTPAFQVINSGDINATCQRGWTPLHYAAFAGHTKLVELLLQKGARIDLLTPTKETALHLAALSSERKLLGELIKAGLNVNQQNTKGLTPLHFALTQKQLFTAQFLIEKGSDPVLADNSGLTPIALMIKTAKIQSSERDPMKLDFWKTMFLVNIIASWCIPYCPNELITPLVVCQIILGPLASTYLLLKGKEWKYTLAIVACEYGLQDAPLLYKTYQYYKLFKIGTQALEGIKKCWRNLAIDRFRSIRNGLIDAVNAAHCAKPFIDLGAKIVPMVTSKGFFSRFFEYMPSCTNISSTDTCLKEFNTLEETRAKTGVRWEMNAPGMEDRWKKFSTVCQREREEPSKCEEIFKALEWKRYFDDATIDITHVDGRYQRWQDFKKIEKEIPGIPISKIFDEFENHRYTTAGKTWEVNAKDITRRWKAFSPSCQKIENTFSEEDQNCTIKFWQFEMLSYFYQMLWEKNLPEMQQRWNEMNPECQQSLTDLETCKSIFWALERERLLVKNDTPTWEQNWKANFENSDKRIKDFMGNCKPLFGVKECDTYFNILETKRIAKSLPTQATTEGMGERWQNLQSICSIMKLPLEECSKMFFELEDKRYFENVAWENHLENAETRLKNFMPLCKENLDPLNLNNINQCETLFKAFEKNRYLTGVEWEKNSPSAWEGIKERWQTFTEDCRYLNPTFKSCNFLFWNILEHNLHTKGEVWQSHFTNLKEDWDSFKEACRKEPELADSCELIFWDALFKKISSSVKIPDQSSCPVIDPADFKEMDDITRIGNEALNPECIRHAQTILNLGDNPTNQECRQTFKKLALMLHPDKASILDIDKEVLEKLFNKVRRSKELVCDNKPTANIVVDSAKKPKVQEVRLLSTQASS